jgi:hypothetical protein
MTKSNAGGISAAIGIANTTCRTDIAWAEKVRETNALVERDIVTLATLNFEELVGAKTDDYLLSKAS